MSPADYTDFINLLLAAGALVAAVLGWLKWVQPSVRKYLGGVIALGNFAVVQENVSSRLISIENELKPNGGGSMRDELRQLGRQVRITAATMRGYVENSDDGSFEADERGVWIFVNSTLLRWVQRRDVEMTGLGWLSCVARDERARVLAEWESAVSEHREFSTEFSLLANGVHAFVAEVVARPIRDPATNDVTGWLGHVRRATSTAAATPRCLVDEE
jgi:PAS domain S-box-containing protein